ncbi:MAG: phosphate ABC transporter ATP-binding protein [Pyrinomonadaceae bacterium]
MAINPHAESGVVDNFSLPASKVPKLAFADVSLFYGRDMALHNLTLAIPERQVTAMIGPSGCGKSTLLRAINRSNDQFRGFRVEGQVELDGRDIYSAQFDVNELRRRVGVVQQRSIPLARSVFENVASGLRELGLVTSREELQDRVESALRDAMLWPELADRLNSYALELSAGQQQRLCIANALAVQPEVLLLDDTASALDPIATQMIEELIVRLKHQYTVVLVTNNMQQAARVSDRTAFLWLGKLIEVNETAQFFTCPEKRLTEDFITGRFI